MLYKIICEEQNEVMNEDDLLDLVYKGHTKVIGQFIIRKLAGGGSPLLWAPKGRGGF